MIIRLKKNYGAIAFVLLIVSGNVAVHNFAQGEVTCSSGSCVCFDQWQHGTSASNCYEGLGAALWSFTDACCHPNVDSDWCTTETTRTNVGTSTKKKMEECTRECTSASCADGKTQIYTSNMYVELVDATRYECNNAHE